MVEARSAVRRRWALAAIVSLALLTALLVAADRAALLAAFRNADAQRLAAAAALVAATLALRSARLALLLGPALPVSPGRANWLRATCLHHLAFVTLPSGTGDITLPWIGRRWLAAPLAATTAALILLRLQDAIVLAALLAAGMALLWAPPSLGAALATACGLIAVAALALAPPLLDRIARAARLGGPPSRTFTGRWRALSTRLVEAMHLAVSLDRGSRQWRMASALAAIGWTTAAAAVVSVFGSLGQPLQPPQALFVLGALNLAGATALLTVAGLGWVEAGLAGALLLLGMPAQQALAIAIVARTLLLALNLLVPAALVLAIPSAARGAD